MDTEWLPRFGGILKGTPLRPPSSCDHVSKGYQCQHNISHYWGQYSAYFQVPSEISPDIPARCQVTYSQILSRHGGRYPTAGKTASYAQTIEKIKSNVNVFPGVYAFLTDYEYTLGADQLTVFGEQEMIHSGTDFFTRYKDLATASVPFVRASGQQRVTDSAHKFNQGFHEAKLAAGASEDPQYPYDVVIISEEAGSNNTLDHGLCTTFETDGYETRHAAQGSFAATFIPTITSRLNTDLSNANITEPETIFLMDLCPFETIASPTGTPSPFCALFSQAEWEQYDYYQTVGKYYSFGPGNALGPTQGTGFVNELISRLTGKPVIDHTSVNNTLDRSPDTFPLGRTLYADFGHDNDMVAAFFALGLYNSTPTLSTSHLMTVEEMRGFSSAWTVPFAARAFFEKMQCPGMEEDMVRVLVNGRVVPLKSCGGDQMGRCTLSKFVESLSFARGGGRWDQCFNDTHQSGISGGHVNGGTLTESRSGETS